MADNRLTSLIKSVTTKFTGQKSTFEPFQDGLLDVPPGAEIINCDDAEITQNARMRDLVKVMLKPADNLDLKVKKAVLGFSNAIPLAGKLFKHWPSLSDVQQEMHGSCYLAAPSIAMTTTMPIQLMSMMREDADHKHVVVRLYDHGKAFYYRVPKTDIVPLHAQFEYHSGENWYAIHFKVYIHHLMRTNPARVDAMLKKHTGNEAVSKVAASVGGTAGEAFYAMTGIKTNPYFISDVLEIAIRQALIETFDRCQKDGAGLQKLAEREMKTHPDYANTLTALIHLYNKRTLLNNMPQRSDMVSVLELCTKVGAQLNEFITKQPVYASVLKDQFIQVQSISDQVLTYVSQVDDLAEQLSLKKPNSQLPQAACETVFRLMQNALKQGSIVTVATKEATQFQSQAPKRDEEYVPEHEYAVLDMVERSVNGEKKYFVRVINPWQAKANQRDANAASGSQTTALRQRFFGEKTTISHARHSVMFNQAVGSKIDDSRLLLTLETLHGKATNYTGVSEIAVEAFVKYFEIMTIGPANEYHVLLNQIYIFMQYARMHCSLPAKHSPDFEEAKMQIDFCTSTVANAVLNPYKDPLNKLLDLQKYTRSEPMLKLAASNPLLKSFLHTLEPVMSLLRQEKFDHKDISNCLTEPNGVLANLRILGNEIKIYHVPAVDLIRRITCYWRDQPEMLRTKQQCQAIKSNSDLSVKEKLHALLAIIDDRSNQLLWSIGRKDMLEKMKEDLTFSINMLNSWEQDKHIPLAKTQLSAIKN